MKKLVFCQLLMLFATTINAMDVIKESNASQQQQERLRQRNGALVGHIHQSATNGGNLNEILPPSVANTVRGMHVPGGGMGAGIPATVADWAGLIALGAPGSVQNCLRQIEAVASSADLPTLFAAIQALTKPDGSAADVQTALNGLMNVGNVEQLHANFPNGSKPKKVLENWLDVSEVDFDDDLYSGAANKYDLAPFNVTTPATFAQHLKVFMKTGDVTDDLLGHFINFDLPDVPGIGDVTANWENAYRDAIDAVTGAPDYATKTDQEKAGLLLPVSLSYLRAFCHILSAAKVLINGVLANANPDGSSTIDDSTNIAVGGAPGKPSAFVCVPAVFESIVTEKDNVKDINEVKNNDGVKLAAVQAAVRKAVVDAGGDAVAGNAAANAILVGDLNNLDQTVQHVLIAMGFGGDVAGTAGIVAAVGLAGGGAAFANEVNTVSTTPGVAGAIADANILAAVSAAAVATVGAGTGDPYTEIIGEAINAKDISTFNALSEDAISGPIFAGVANVKNAAKVIAGANYVGVEEVGHKLHHYTNGVAAPYDNDNLTLRVNDIYQTELAELIKLAKVVSSDFVNTSLNYLTPVP